MTLVCRNCGRDIQRDSINLRGGVADCTHCGVKFSLSADELNRLRPLDAATPSREILPMPRMMLPKPEDIKIVEDSEKLLKFGYRSFHWFAIFPFLFSFLIFLGSGTVLYDGWQALIDTQGDRSIFTKIFLIVLALLVFSILVYSGFLLLRQSLAKLVNRTLISADHRLFTIDNGLVPLQKNYEIEASQLERFYLSRTPEPKDGPINYHFDLIAKLQNGQEISLIRKMEPENARYIVQKLDNFYALSG